MKLKKISPKVINLFFTLFLLISCNTSSNASEDPSIYALKKSSNFNKIKGQMVYSISNKELTFMELRLRNLYTGTDEILLSSKNTKYKTMVATSVSRDGKLIIIDAQKKKVGYSYILIYDLKKRTFKELDIGNDAIPGDISPDKSKITFYSDFENNNNFKIYISNLNGKNLIQLSCPGIKCTHPAWSEDGMKIVFVVESRKVYEYNIGSHKQKLLYSLVNKKKNNLGYPHYYKGDIYFSKVKKQLRVKLNLFQKL